jgi:hypothetical protein
VTTVSSYRVSVPLTGGTTYYWRVRAFNAASQYSYWSSVFKFTTAP